MAIITFTSGSRVPIEVKRFSVPNGSIWHELQWPEWTRTLTVFNEDASNNLHVSTEGMVIEGAAFASGSDDFFTLFPKNAISLSIAGGQGRLHVGTGSLYVATDVASSGSHKVAVMAEFNGKI